MKIKDNVNFLEVKEFYMPLSIKDVEREKNSKHLSDERKNRVEFAFNLNKLSDGSQAEIDKAFLVDKGHKDGKEIHLVSKKGIIFILNENKFLYGKGSFITVLLGRPNQVKRLYEACKIPCPKDILNYCRDYQDKGYNETINN